MTDTLPVTVTILGLERVTSMGATVALAQVELDIYGIVINVAGIRVLRGSDGKLAVLAPRVRSPRTGEWLACVALPSDLWGAIADETLAAVRERSAAMGKPWLP